MRVGVLASQGDFAAHVAMLGELGAETSEIRVPADFAGLDGLVIPGGESTTLMKAIERDRLRDEVACLAAEGRPILGTCAGMIVLDREHLGLMDVVARRNAFGRQQASFETELEVEGIGPDPLRAVFIRAPWIDDAGSEVDVLASFAGHPVVVREANLLACAFHPELTDDSRMHALFMAIVSASAEAREEANA